MKRITTIILIVLATCFILNGCGTTRKLADIEEQKVSKIQVISTMGNPEYGADSKIFMDKSEIKDFVTTFNSGIIGEKVSDDDILIGFTSRYTFYNGDKIIAEFYFNANNTKVVALEKGYYFVDYGEKADSPYELYQDSKSTEIVVDLDGKEMDLIRYNGATYVKSEMSEDNLKWLEKYNSLTEDEKLAISFTPDLGEPFEPK